MRFPKELDDNIFFYIYIYFRKKGNSQMTIEIKKKNFRLQKHTNCLCGYRKIAVIELCRRKRY